MSRSTRREFLGATVLGAAALAAPRAFAIPRRGERLKLGVIGVGGRGNSNIRGVAGEEIVALCDVDEGRLTKAGGRFPDAKRYLDFRELVGQRGLDAVVVSTPDHTHAPAAMAAMNAGLHVYCEKPLTHTVHEARRLREVAKAKGLVTQMGTQIHAQDNYRRVVELVRSGAIGTVRKVHVFCSKSWSGRPIAKDDRPDVPEGLHWDLWLGPSSETPYHRAYHPAGWRGYWRFGTGTLGDMGAHYLDLAHWALDLHWPTRIRAEGPEPHPECAPKYVKATWDHPAKGDRKAVQVTWWDGGKRPGDLKDLGLSWGNGVLFLGDEGWIISDYGRHVLGPKDRFAEFRRPEAWIPKSRGHHAEWIAACKKGDPEAPTCRFDYAGPLTETLLLGVVAHRTGETVRFDPKSGMAIDSGSAQRLLDKTYREGWQSLR